MKVQIEVRKDMLSKLKDSLMDGSANQKLIFTDIFDNPLCEIDFLDLEAVQDGSTSASYKFLADDSTSILRGNAINSGTVTNFKIQGKEGAGVGISDTAVSGTVGGLSSGADIKVNRISWTGGKTIVTITDLTLVLPQGN